MEHQEHERRARRPLVIRNATAEDEPYVIALWRAANLVTSYNDPSKDFHFARAKEGSDILVGLDAQGSIVGSVMVGHDGHRGWIYYLASDPSHRNQGIGRSMVAAAEQWLKDRGVVKLMLLVRETNTQVIDFYEHLGFEAIPRVIMQKWLQDDA
ncbi:GNAT family acetyltransferase [Rhodoligotrophos ferricapiens]|uniref:GNAT family acetyltransferase n=1 Tax=Rhodoligotrophos ferricapiens TaxID=3069264 RepID=UPI00315CC5FF